MGMRKANKYGVRNELKERLAKIKSGLVHESGSPVRDVLHNYPMTVCELTGVVETLAIIVEELTVVVEALVES